MGWIHGGTNGAGRGPFCKHGKDHYDPPCEQCKAESDSRHAAYMAAYQKERQAWWESLTPACEVAVGEVQEFVDFEAGTTKWVVPSSEEVASARCDITAKKYYASIDAYGLAYR